MKIHQIKIDFHVTEQISRFVYVYLLEADSLYLIDSGVFGCEKQIMDYLDSIGRDISDIKGIFLTHAHPDHIGSAAWFQEHTGCKIYASEGEKRWIEDIPLSEKLIYNLCMEVKTNMNQYVTGAVIKELREKNRMTQLQLAEKLGVSDKSVSKWETSRGLPDITLLEPIAEAFSISVTELISGNTIHNANISANMLRSKFYVCPVCGNVIHSMGEAAIHCHGIQLMPLEAEQTDEHHMIFIERVEDEYYVRIDHSMTKEHYISFVAAASSDDMQMRTLYPEGNAEARFKIRGVRRIFFYCNRDGLFSIDPVKGIDDKESGYDDSQERRELEKAADMLFG